MVGGLRKSHEVIEDHPSDFHVDIGVLVVILAHHMHLMSPYQSACRHMILGRSATVARVENRHCL